MELFRIDHLTYFCNGGNETNRKRRVNNSTHARYHSSNILYFQPSPFFSCILCTPRSIYSFVALNAAFFPQFLLFRATPYCSICLCVSFHFPHGGSLMFNLSRVLAILFARWICFFVSKYNWVSTASSNERGYLKPYYWISWFKYGEIYIYIYNHTAAQSLSVH